MYIPFITPTLLKRKARGSQTKNLAPVNSVYAGYENFSKASLCYSCAASFTISNVDMDNLEAACARYVLPVFFIFFRQGEYKNSVQHTSKSSSVHTKRRMVEFKASYPHTHFWIIHTFSLNCKLLRARYKQSRVGADMDSKRNPINKIIYIFLCVRIVFVCALHCKG